MSARPAWTRVWYWHSAEAGFGLVCAAIASLLAAAMVVWFWVPRIQERSAMLDDAIALRAEVRTARSQSTPAPDAQRVALQKFERALLSPEEVDSTVARLFALAHAHGLTVGEAQYEPAQPHARFAWVNLNLPIKGPYTGVRALLVDALTFMPAVAVDDLAIARPQVSSEEVATTLRMRLYLRGDPEAASKAGPGRGGR